MLGLYVSGHPLDGASQLMERNRDTSIAELLASGRADGEAQIAGMIAAADRRVSKKSGNPCAAVTIEDLDASVEVLFFPGVYQRHADELDLDAVVAVHGQISEHDGTVSIIAQDLTPLDISRPGGGTPLVIALHESQVTAGLVAGLKHILRAHPGTTQVHIRLRRTEGPTLLVDLPDFRVDPDSSFAADITRLLPAAPGGSAA
jgi:DNA polymerase-3 subunit alpha